MIWLEEEKDAIGWEKMEACGRDPEIPGNASGFPKKLIDTRSYAPQCCASSKFNQAVLLSTVFKPWRWPWEPERSVVDMAPKATGTKFYAVRKGFQPGIYLTWPDCQKQTNGFRGAEFKSFPSREEAEQFIGSTPGPAMSQTSPKPPALATVKRSRSGSPGPGQASTIAESDVYQIEFDGAAKGNPGRAGAGALVRNPDGSVACELREGLGSATNNVAEYRAFILGLKGALDRGFYRVRAQGDSKLLVEQILGRYKVRNVDLIPLCEEALKLIQNFEEFSLRHVDREFNSAADKLANEAVFLPETKFESSFPNVAY